MRKTGFGGEKMDELVYLFELDSVRSTPEEILRGQQALFREVALKGNRVVLTFNQLTDSHGFLCAIGEEKSRGQILELFRMGALKYSRYAPPGYYDGLPDQGRRALTDQLAACRLEHGELFRQGALKAYEPLPDRAPQRVIRTASHYVQDSVERCLNDTGETFLFSALPFRSTDRTVLRAISYALQYSDPAVLDTCPARSEGDRKRLAFAKAYVELLLSLSREPLAVNPERQDRSRPMTAVLEQVIRACREASPYPAYSLWEQLGRGAEVLERLWNRVAAQGSPNRRSDWYAALLADEGPREDRCMAEAIVDLCYNYTMAGSISGLEESVGTGTGFPPGFLERLAAYWADGQTGAHRFLQPDSTAAAPRPAGALPPWDTAARLLKTVPAAGATWERRMLGSHLRQVRNVALYLLAFLITSLLLDSLEGGVTTLGERGRINEAVLALGNIVLFGIAGSLLAWWLKLPDILDSVKQLGHTVLDVVRLFRARCRMEQKGG